MWSGCGVRFQLRWRCRLKTEKVFVISYTLGVKTFSKIDFFEEIPVS